MPVPLRHSSENPERRLDPLAQDLDWPCLPSFPLCSGARMYPQADGKLSLGEPSGDSGSLEPRGKGVRRPSERVISEEGDDLGHVLDIWIEAAVLPIVDGVSSRGLERSGRPSDSEVKRHYPASPGRTVLALVKDTLDVGSYGDSRRLPGVRSEVRR